MWRTEQQSAVSGDGVVAGDASAAAGRPRQSDPPPCRPSLSPLSPPPPPQIAWRHCCSCVDVVRAAPSLNRLDGAALASGVLAPNDQTVSTCSKLDCKMFSFSCLNIVESSIENIVSLQLLKRSDMFAGW